MFPPLPTSMRIGLFLLCIWQSEVIAEEEWVRFWADSHLYFDLPRELEADPGNADGESLWINNFHSKDGAFRVESSGYNSVWREARLLSMNTRQYITKVWLAPGRGVYRKFGKHYLLAVSVNRQRNEKVLHKISIGNSSSNGYAVKSIRISYPWDRRGEFDKWLVRIEASWDPEQTWKPAYFPP